MKHVKTFENFKDKVIDAGFKAVDKIDPKNREHYQRAVDYVVDAIESGDIEGTLEDVKKILNELGGMRVPFTNKKMNNKFGDANYKVVINHIANKILLDAKKQIEENETY